MTKVLISDPLNDRALGVFTARGIEVVAGYELSTSELLDNIGDCQGLAVRSRTKVTDALLSAAKRLKVIGRAGVGVDNIDLAAARRRGILVMNTPNANSVAAAEHTIGMLFALARQIPAADRSVRSRKWEKACFLGVQIAGKSIGVIGCGNVGSLVAERARGLGMKVVVHDPFLTPERLERLGFLHVSLDHLLSASDFVTLHVPLTEETRNVIDATAIARMKRGVRIINCARGELIVEQDLAAALDTGHVAGAAIDVFVEEPALNSPLLGRENVVATPHLGASTVEAQENVAIQIAEQIANFLLTGIAANVISL
jgi:D-3-phosphoglycerate dehydrogenase